MLSLRKQPKRRSLCSAAEELDSEGPTLGVWELTRGHGLLLLIFQSQTSPSHICPLMSGFDLVPVEGGEPIHLPTGETVIGRGPLLRVGDKRVSRHHGLLENLNGRLRLKPTHVNPCFVRSSLTDDPRPLQKDSWFSLQDGALFSLLPDQLLYRVVAVAAAGSSRNGQRADEELSQTPPPVEAPPPQQDQAGDRSAEAPPRRRVLPAWMMAAKQSSSSLSPKAASSSRPTAPKKSKMASAEEEEEEEGRGEEEEEPKKRRNQQEEKEEKADRPSGSSSSSTPSAAPRTPCPYGRECYRKNPAHFQECSHPGDADYTEEEEEPEDADRPECPYGTDCYRRNPLHRREYKHTKRPAYHTRPRQKVAQKVAQDAAQDSDDSFINDDSEDGGEDSDYAPPDSDDSGEEDVRRLQKEAQAFLKKQK